MMKVALGELQGLAQEVLAKLPEGKDTATILALTGELGAGKTTFVQALAKELGVQDTVQSPTYVLMKSYPISQGDTLRTGLSKVSPYKKLVHIDAYRLENAEEFAALKPETFLNDPRNLVCIEWPERVEGALPAPDVVLRFSADGAADTERYISIKINPE
jgi:tRNA threonylcarbamoyladenosine biosynthesis protein TsaE